MTDKNDPRRKRHPVWEAHDLVRTARLNTLYWTVKLQRAKRKNQYLELLIAIAVPSSGFASLAIWQTQYGAYVWTVVIIVATLAAAGKPLLAYTEIIQSYEAVVARYRTIEGQLDELESDISRAEDYNEQMKSRLQEIKRTVRKALGEEPYEVIDEELREALVERVIRELPVDQFYVPKE